MTEQVSLEAAIECVLRNGPTFETIAGLCKMAVEASQKQADAPVAWMDADDNIYYTEEDAYKTGVQPIQTLMRGPKPTGTWRCELTEEQIESLWDHGMYIHCSGITALRAITRAIEAAHGITGETK